MKQRETEEGIVWKMKNQTYKKEIATHSNLERIKRLMNSHGHIQ